MDDLYVIELEPEVVAWLELLPGKQHRKVEEYADLLAVHGPLTPMPFARPLRDGVYELRPTLDGVATRITYWFAPGRRVVLLTVFRKTRMHEPEQVKRAVTARMVCEKEHSPAHITYSRSEEGDA
ncbi:type II toxin-antitoxin system RelE/ParE family toxin [Streptomyces sp. NPDC059708]|uniref:type II toxin-antitoxin system RelE/ParE family toxin n=1 Tax=Streptomyces sp. NPDC059708 TaxID=3346916 RepID=UPI0036C75F76